MRINSNYRTVELDEHPYIKEDSYCFCSINTLDRDVYDLEPYLDIHKDAVSVFWTAEQLEKFRPDIGTHEFRKIVEKECIDDRIKTLKRIIRSPHYADFSKKRAKEKIERMKSQIIIFVKIEIKNK